MRGLLLFLRHEPYASDKGIWESLTTSHKESFRALFNKVALRHTKRLVRDELSIPTQKRYVVTMPFTAVEEQHYQGLFQQLITACDLDTQGYPTLAKPEEWDVEDYLEPMRAALDRLRQTALHPEVGHRNRRALGYRGGPMRTVAEVLDAMVEQSETKLRADQRTLLQTRLTRGQLLEETPRVKEALAIWDEVLRTSDGLANECRAALQSEVEQAKLAGKDGDKDPSSDDEVEDEDDADDTAIGRIGEARRKLRSALEIQHKAVFFCANAHFQIKSNKDITVPDSDEFKELERLEVGGYERAKRIRKEILQEAHWKASKLMATIAKKASNQSFAVIPEFKSVPQKGIESRTIVESLEGLCDALNEQANQIDDWREHVIQLLLKPLVDEDDEIEITGEEYEDSTKIQEEIVVYVQVLRAAIADRLGTISGQANKLVEHEAKVAIAQAKEGEGPFPEKLLELFALRGKVRPPQTMGSLRGSVAELRALSNKLRGEAVGNSRAAMELEIVISQLQVTQRQVTEQTKVVTAMEQEVDRFTTAMNTRVEYYRQLQAVSDMVAPYEGPKDDAAMENVLKEENTHRERFAVAESKHRYRTLPLQSL